VEYEEALKARAVIREAPDCVHDLVDDLLADCVVTAGVVVGSVFFARDENFWVIEVLVSASADLVDDCWLQVYEDGARHLLAIACFVVECVESVDVCVFCAAY